MPADAIDFLLDRVKVNDAGCFEWQLSKFGGGYGRTKRPGTRKQISTHRLSFEVFRGRIPDGMMVCHKCDNPCCINPAHLFLGTGKQNMEDAVIKGRVARGERLHTARLSEFDVLQIIKESEAGRSARDMARDRSLSSNTITAILRNETWKHIKRDPVKIGKGRWKKFR